MLHCWDGHLHFIATNSPKHNNQYGQELNICFPISPFQISSAKDTATSLFFLQWHTVYKWILWLTISTNSSLRFWLRGLPSIVYYQTHPNKVYIFERRSPSVTHACRYQKVKSKEQQEQHWQLRPLHVWLKWSGDSCGEISTSKVNGAEVSRAQAIILVL